MNQTKRASHLSWKIQLCELIERLNENGHQKVVQLLQQYSDFEFKDSSNLSMKLTFSVTKTMNTDSLAIIVDTIQQMINNPSLVSKNTKPFNSNINLKTTTQSANDKHEIKKQNIILFPLSRLPIDLIDNARLFFNETDIFQFEQCCCLFYKMINNTIYLNKCNNFKKFEMTNKRLKQMTESEYSFFKYCTASDLELNVWPPMDAEDIPEKVTHFMAQIEKQLMARSTNYL